MLPSFQVISYVTTKNCADEDLNHWLRRWQVQKKSENCTCYSVSFFLVLALLAMSCRSARLWAAAGILK
jgi:hypothetical protein